MLYTTGWICLLVWDDNITTFYFAKNIIHDKFPPILIDHLLYSSLSWQLNSTLSNSTKRFRVCTRMCIIGLCTRMNTHSIDFSARPTLQIEWIVYFLISLIIKKTKTEEKVGSNDAIVNIKMNAWRLTTRKKGSKWHYPLLCLPTDNKTAAGFLTPVEL